MTTLVPPVTGPDVTERPVTIGAGGALNGKLNPASAGTAW